jgi:hypothetical protein
MVGVEAPIEVPVTVAVGEAAVFVIEVAGVEIVSDDVC